MVLLARLIPPAWLRWRRRRAGALPPEQQQAVDLIAAIDAGGVPLSPARVNAIARGLGLDVSPRAPLEQTLARIRAAVGRIPS